MQVLNGFVKIHRKLLQWGWYQDNVVKGVFIHILLTANFKDTLWMGRVIKRGQVVVGMQNLAAELGFTRQQVRTALNKLKSTGEITTEATNKFTLVTVVNWEDYQCLDNEATNKQPAEIVNKLLIKLETLKKSTNKITNKNDLESYLNSGIEELEQILSTNTLTNEQPTNNQQITNNQPQRKNIKNDKNVKNNSLYGDKPPKPPTTTNRFKPPTVEEVREYCKERDNNIDAERFIDYYSSNGWKVGRNSMKDWKAAIRTWERKEKGSSEQMQTQKPKECEIKLGGIYL